MLFVYYYYYYSTISSPSFRNSFGIRFDCGCTHLFDGLAFPVQSGIFEQ